MVLYFGMNHWSDYRSLYDCLTIPEELKPYISDYKINVFEIAYLEDEQVELFQSDFRFVADYFVQMRKNGDYKPSTETIRHVDETLKLMAVLTQDDRFLEVQNSVERSVSNMCEAMDKAEAKGKVLAYADVGLSVDEIISKTGLSKEEIERILQESGE